METARGWNKIIEGVRKEEEETVLGKVSCTISVQRFFQVCLFCLPSKNDPFNCVHSRN